MENRVGDNAPSDAKWKQLMKQLDDLLEQFKQFGVTLSDSERGSAQHPRIGVEPHVHTVHALALKYGISVPHMPLAGMLNDLALEKDIHPFEQKTATLALIA